jgi:hypothetical protein
VAKGLVTGPVWLPELRGLEPYTGLVRDIARVMVDPAAVSTFPYDWRLPVAHNARLLGEAAEQHLARWRANPAADPRARVVLIAHSMGGLLAHHLVDVLRPADLIRHTFTIGTPFYGAAGGWPRRGS